MNKELFKPARQVLPAATAVNEAGGVAYEMDDRHALAQLAVTGCLTRTFYTDAEAQLKSVVDVAGKVDDGFLARTAVYARERGHMKDMPALLVAVLAARRSPLLAPTFRKVIDNGKMLRNFVQVIRSGVTGRKSLGSAPKRLVGEWFEERSVEVIFRQSVGANPSMADIIKLAHPRPNTPAKEAMFGWMLGREVDRAALPDLVREFEAFKAGQTADVPAVPFEMLTALPLDTRAWTEIARKARWQWTRMNLNTLVRHGVFADPEMVDLVAARLSSPADIRDARVFPYQLLAAYQNASSEVPQKIRNALQDALEVATGNVPKFPGKVVVMVDVSSSMDSPVTGHRLGSTTKVKCVDVAALISSVVLRANDEAEVIPFNTQVKEVTLNPRDSVMTNTQAVSRLLGGGTACSAPLTRLNERKAKADLLVLVSDNMSWADTYGRPAYGSTKPVPTKLMEEWTTFRKRNPTAKLVCIDIQPNTTIQAQERADILNVGGFTDACFSMIDLFARGEMDQGHWVGEIEKIEL